MKQYISVPPKKYFFIPISQMKEEDFSGFYTENLCECVFMYVKSDIGYAGAHFTRLDDPKFLANKVKEDFAKATWLEVVLVGGFFNQVTLPWKFHGRNLTINSKDVQNSDLNAHEKIRYLNEEEEVIEIQNYDPDFFVKNLIDQGLDGLYKVDLNSLDKEIKGKNFHAFFSNYGTGEKAVEISFYPRGIKDFTGCQNILSLANQLTSKLEGYSLRHFFCENDSVVMIDFSEKDTQKSIHAGNFTVDPHILSLLPERLVNIPNKRKYYPQKPILKAKAFIDSFSNLKNDKITQRDTGFSKYCC